MLRNSFFWTPILALLFRSLAVVMPVAATQYEGNDNAEFGFPSTLCGYGYFGSNYAVTATFQSNMGYTSGNGHMSVQYNPDEDASKQCQTGYQWYGGNDWFQSGIVGQSSNNCAVFTIQVYNLDFPYEEDWSWFSNGGSCTTVSAMFNNGAQWYMSEHVNACLTNCGSGFEKIDSVSFHIIGGSGGGSYYYTEYPPVNWYWLRSNICFCGTGGESATFGSGNGVLNYQGSGIGIIGPPIDVETAENSNMLYTCMSQGSNQITQAFDLTVTC